jgi:1-deoxy-D-xylulose-5-phosphate reductoisomerase
LGDQINRYKPQFAVIAEVAHFPNLKEYTKNSGTTVFGGHDQIMLAQREIGKATTVNALVGYSGFQPSYTALESGGKLCLANKESLVVGGEIITRQLEKGGHLLPVDSEHSAIFQCLAGERMEDVAELILTASGGPFRTLPAADMASITVEQALRHPNWSMGSKITIDSATLMNKGLEVIEAFWLFGIPLERLKAVIHPQSIIHSMVKFVDGSIKAQLGMPDMHLPILYALSHPVRWPYAAKPMPWESAVSMTFEPVDETRFPCFRLSREALQAGGYAPAVLNAANEVAVHRFLKREIGYIHIPQTVSACLESCRFPGAVSPSGLEEADAETRRFASSLRFQH